MSMHENFVMTTPVGRIYVETRAEAIVRLEYHTRKPVTLHKLGKFAARVKKQIENYFKSPNGLELPVQLEGTAFQKKVWRALQRIPVGQTRTYGDISAQLNSSPRAVGNACRANPVPLVVPCHRVVASSGIGGFGGETSGRNINCKSWLLQHEASH